MLFDIDDDKNTIEDLENFISAIDMNKLKKGGVTIVEGDNITIGEVKDGSIGYIKNNYGIGIQYVTEQFKKMDDDNFNKIMDEIKELQSSLENKEIAGENSGLKKDEINVLNGGISEINIEPEDTKREKVKEWIAQKGKLILKVIAALGKDIVKNRFPKLSELIEASMPKENADK